MRDEAGFRDAREALDALEVDRQRVRRRVRAVSWWLYPAIAITVGAIIGLFTAENGFWFTMAGVAVLSGLGWMARRRLGVAERIQLRAPGIILIVVLVLGLLGHMLAATLTIRFDVEEWMPAVACSGAIFTLLGFVGLDRLGELRCRRAR